MQRWRNLRERNTGSARSFMPRWRARMKDEIESSPPSNSPAMIFRWRVPTLSKPSANCDSSLSSAFFTPTEPSNSAFVLAAGLNARCRVNADIKCPLDDDFRAAPLHFVDDIARGARGFLRLHDRSADDDIIDASAHRLRRRHDALLIVVAGFFRPDAGRHNHEAAAASGANLGDFVRRGDDAVHSRLLAQARETHHLIADLAGDAELLEIALVQAREHGNGEENRPPERLLDR